MKNLWITGIIVWLWPLIIFSQDGTLDSTFGNNGSIVLPKIFTQYELVNAVFDAQGRALILTTSIQDSTIVLYRYLSNGLPDSTFGIAGEVVYEGGQQLNNVIFQEDRKVLIGINDFHLGNNRGSAVLRLNENGSPDSGFGNQGLVLIESDERFFSLGSMCLQPDRKIVISGSLSQPDGWSASDVMLLRLTPDGTIDSSLGEMGKVVTDLTATGRDSDFGGPVAIQTDGKIVVAANHGAFFTGAGPIAMMRHLPNGTLDISFGLNGTFIDSIRSEYNSVANTMVIADDSTILVAGSDGHPIGGGPFLTLRRFNNEGQPDTSFADNGWFITAHSDVSGEFSDVVVQQDHKILATGLWHDGTGPYCVLMRFNRDGTPDPVFGLDGKTLFQDNLQPTRGTDLYLNPDGKISLLGYTNIDPDGLGQVFIARFYNDFNTSVPGDPKKVTLYMNLFPNPSDESELNITYSLSAPGKISAYLFDSYARLISVLSEEEERPAGLQNDVVSLPGELVPGMYIVRLTTGSGESGSTRFIRL